MATPATTRATAMSLNERFTALRQQDPRPSARQRVDMRLQLASAKNRRLAFQMSQRPTVRAALRGNRGRTSRGRGLNVGLLRNPSLSGSLTRLDNIRSRLTLRGNTQWRSPLLRSPDRGSSLYSSAWDKFSGPRGRLNRSASLSSLSGRLGVPTIRGGIRTGRIRGMRRGGGSRGGSLPRSSSLSRLNTSTPTINGRFRGVRRDRGGMRGRGRGGGGVVNRVGGGQRGDGQRGLRGARGRRGGRGGNGWRGRGRGGANTSENKPKKTKEELDKELDAYMSFSRSALDKQIDDYMSHPNTSENWE